MPRLRTLLIVIAVLAAAALGAWAVLRATPAGQARHLLAQSRQLIARGDATAADAALRTLLQQFPHADAAGDAWFALAQIAEQREDWLAAQQAYQRILQEFPMSDRVVPAQDALGNANMRLLLSPVVTAQDHLYVVQPGDTLAAIAKRFHVTVEWLRRANQLSGDMIHPAMRLKIPGGTFGVLVDKSHNTLMVKRGEDIIKQYAVATGSDNSTPAGAFTIMNRLVNPPWYTPTGVIPAGDPRNVLGTRWLGFDKPGYGIHGTTDPSTMGQQVTAGCVRMRNADVEELFIIIPEGAVVTIIN